MEYSNEKIKDLTICFSKKGIKHIKGNIKVLLNDMSIKIIGLKSCEYNFSNSDFGPFVVEKENTVNIVFNGEESYNFVNKVARSIIKCLSTEKDQTIHIGKVKDMDEVFFNYIKKRIINDKPILGNNVYVILIGDELYVTDYINVTFE